MSTRSRVTQLERQRAAAAAERAATLAGFERIQPLLADPPLRDLLVAANARHDAILASAGIPPGAGRAAVEAVMSDPELGQIAGRFVTRLCDVQTMETESGR